MKPYIKFFSLIAVSVLILFQACQDETIPVEPNELTKTLAKCGEDSVVVTVFAAGLNAPRGLKFGPGGYLYVQKRDWEARILLQVYATRLFPLSVLI